MSRERFRLPIFAIHTPLLWTGSVWSTGKIAMRSPIFPTGALPRRAALAAVTARYRESGWPAERSGAAITGPYSAQSAGPAPWHLYRCTIHTAVGVGTAEPYGATRWRFA
ncbi:hypothetical protein GCM10027088_61910 [Nocardia goodfellowii]